jgi:hypothetical protein
MDEWEKAVRHLQSAGFGIAAARETEAKGQRSAIDLYDLLKELPERKQKVVDADSRIREQFRLELLGKHDGRAEEEAPNPPVLLTGAGSCRGRSESRWSARSEARTYDLDCDLCAATGCPARGGRPGRSGYRGHGARDGGDRLAAGAGERRRGGGPRRASPTLRQRAWAAAP